MHYKVIEDRRELGASRFLRYKVFVEEQKVPECLEKDRLDDGSIHVIACRGRRVIGTGRITAAHGNAKISRLAVERKERGKGLGRGIMLELESIAKRKGVKKIILSSNFQSIPFYEKLGYRKRGSPFVECGGEVQGMTKCLSLSPSSQGRLQD
ncbi:MAG: GNAT family N-acetyltransferase [Theionarchaea archaeon]|nr:GNAT family N-acetyltransferase [Theionarchaea archaeon]MBU7038291.1 GNAT family N-acetyltransferase [Theionarchaea archaeon]